MERIESVGMINREGITKTEKPSIGLFCLCKTMRCLQIYIRFMILHFSGI